MLTAFFGFSCFAITVSRAGPTEDALAKLAAEKAKVNASVGNVYWLSDPVLVCQSPKVREVERERCPKITEGKLRVISVLWSHNPDDQRFDFVEIEFIPTGKRGYIIVPDALNEFATYDIQGQAKAAAAKSKAREKAAATAAAADCTRRGQPRIGMTRTEVEATCWGRPTKINRTVTANGTTLQAVYSRNRYIYYMNDVAAAIQDEGY
jgi:hypothetical protein